MFKGRECSGKVHVYIGEGEWGWVDQGHHGNSDYTEWDLKKKFLQFAGVTWISYIS